MTMTAAEVAAERERRSQKSGGGKNGWVKIKGGSIVYLRIGPPWKKNGEVWKDSFKHGYYPREVSCAKNDTNKETGKKRSCPVDKRWESLKGDRSTKAKKLWSLLKVRSEGLWNVLVAKKYKKLSDGRIIVKAWEDGKFKIWRNSPKWQDLLLEIFSNEAYTKKSLLGVADPRFGRLIRVKRTGAGKDDTVYEFKAVEHASPISKSKLKRKKLLATLVNLDAVVSGSSDEELSAFVRKMEKRAKKLAALDSDDEDEEDDEDEDEEDDEGDDEDEGKPKKSKKKKKSKSDDDDDDDEDSDDDEDDEESDDEDEDSDDDDDLESRYKKMKKGVKKKKAREEDEDDDEEEDDDE